MTHAQFLIRQAEQHWQQGQELPRSLFQSMLAQGVNIDREHLMFNHTMHGCI